MRPRNVLVMLVLTVLAALAWISLRPNAGGGGGGLPPTMPQFDKSDVSKIAAMHDGKPLVLRRRTDRSDAWEVEVGTTTLRADANAVDELLTQLARQETRQRFRYVEDKVSEADVKGYGLDAPATTIELTVPGKTILVRYGKKTREGGGTYVDSGAATDVWVVGGGVVETLLAMGATGARSPRLTDIRQFDVGKVEIVKGGVTILEAARDTSQIWRVSQPFKGYAEPEAFEKLLGKLTGIEVTRWADIDTKDLKSRDLEPPAAEVTLTPKRGGEPSVVLVGKAQGDGVFVMEKGRNNIAVTPRRLLDAILEIEANPGLIRDHSFTRIGIDGIAISVKLGTVVYELRKEGASWDVTKPDRHPGDDATIRGVMEKIRSWKTVEFADAATPGEKGITDGGDSIEIELAKVTQDQSVARTTLLIGARADATSWWAQRKSPEGDGGVERVDGSVIELLAQGYPQFRQQTVRDFSVHMGDLLSIEREAGKGEEGAKAASVVVAQDSARNVPWAFAEQGPGAVGTLDIPALLRILNVLRTIHTKRWILWNSAMDKELGFSPPLAETLSIVLKFSGASGTPPGGSAEQTLMIGKKAPGGGYFARFGDAHDGAWAFVLSESDVEVLMAPLAK